MKAIILAGGLGTRLGKYTKNLPKCMLDFDGKSLLERQIETYKSCGINDIIVTRKHLKDKINIPGIRYDDKEEDGTNMVADFMHARSEFDDDIIMSYGDVLFEPRVLRSVISSDSSVSVVVDTEWKNYWQERLGDWREDSESFIMDDENKVISLGKPNPSPEEMNARYVGLIKFSKDALERAQEIYDLEAVNHWETPWYYSKSFKQAHMTDFIQVLIDNGLDVKAVPVKKGWLEFDTEKDYELANQWLAKENLGRFLKLEDGI
jgi:L-glutamine-phosphate cytidylyltransferase